MEIITVRFQEDILKKIDESISKHYFNSRTEFIREAVRNQLEEANKQKLIENFLKLKGISKTNTSDENLEKAREKVGEEIAKKFNIKL